MVAQEEEEEWDQERRQEMAKELPSAQLLEVLEVVLGLVHWLAPVLVRRSVAAQLGLRLVQVLALASEVAQASAQALVEASQKALAWV